MENTQKERKDIPFTLWLYQATDNEIRSVNYNRTWNSKLLTQWIKKWYSYVWLYLNWKVKQYWVHRLIAEAFIENPDNKPQVNHKNWNKLDNYIENLERVTKSENATHSYAVLWNKSNIPRIGCCWKHNPFSKIVLQYSKDMILLKTRDCTMDIQRELWYDSCNISACCWWKQKTSNWFIWKYTN